MNLSFKERDIVLFNHVGKDGKVYTHPFVVFYILEDCFIAFQVTDRQNFQGYEDSNRKYNSSFFDIIYVKPLETFFHCDENDGFAKASKILINQFYKIEINIKESHNDIVKVGVMKNKEKFEKIKNIIEDIVRLMNGDIFPLMRWK